MALRHNEYTEAGAVVAAIDVDSPAQHAAMVEKLNLPFPILSDPDRSQAIEPYGVADPRDPREIAIPTTLVIDAEGNEAWRKVSRDFADRPSEDEALEIVRGLGLDPVEQPLPAVGAAEPGSNAMAFGDMRTYFRGAKFAAVAMGRRHPEGKEDGKAYAALMDRYIEDATAMYRIKKAAAAG